MNNKTATLGLGAAVIGILTAVIGAAFAGKGAARRAAEEQDEGVASPAATSEPEPATPATASQPAAMEWPTPATDTATKSAAVAESYGLLAPAAAPGPQSAVDGPSGPTAHAQPAPMGEEGHAAPDLATDAPLGPDHRAPVAFRPDMDAPMTAAEREALRPATGPSPSLMSDEGAGVQGPGGSLT